jgi:hypothetical protein
LPLLYAVAAITGMATVLFTLADHVLITDLVGCKLFDATANAKPSAFAEISGLIVVALVAWLIAPLEIAADPRRLSCRRCSSVAYESARRLCRHPRFLQPRFIDDAHRHPRRSTDPAIRALFSPRRHLCLR